MPRSLCVRCVLLRLAFALLRFAVLACALYFSVQQRFMAITAVRLAFALRSPCVSALRSLLRALCVCFAVAFIAYAFCCVRCCVRLAFCALLRLVRLAFITCVRLSRSLFASLLCVRLRSPCVHYSLVVMCVLLVRFAFMVRLVFADFASRFLVIRLSRLLCVRFALRSALRSPCVRLTRLRSLFCHRFDLLCVRFLAFVSFNYVLCSASLSPSFLTFICLYYSAAAVYFVLAFAFCVSLSCK
jgi:hypothetical protein